MRIELTGGNLALDLAGTVAERGSTRLEHLRTGGDLVRWLDEAGLAGLVRHVTDAELDQVKALREALYRLARAASVDGHPAAADVALVNAAAAWPPPVPVARADGTVQRHGDLRAVLSAVARAGLELLEEPARGQLRWCADADCTRGFLDRSRGGRRRWCGMAGCGDRAKAVAYRARRRTSHTA